VKIGIKQIWIGILVISLSMLLIHQRIVYSKDTEPQKNTSNNPTSNQSCMTSFFTNSLHSTGEGMRYWYEKEGGFMGITNIPYDKLGCKSCHVKSCDTCHADTSNGQKKFSVKKAKRMNICLPCHGREGMTFMSDKKKDQLDVHVSAGMICSDCHKGTDVHGDGTFRSSMRHPKSVQANCSSCHVDQRVASPAFDPNTKSHRVHKEKLDCSACHVSNTTACINCHFDSFLETKQYQGNSFPVKEWLLLINYNGKVTSGSAMTLVYKNKKFLAYVPYYTHSVTPEGRKCDDCHMNQAVRDIKDGKTVTMVDFKDGDLIHWKGVAPTMQDKLNWVFLNKTKNGWEPVPGDESPRIQFVGYGTELTEEQFKKLTVNKSVRDPEVKPDL